jgi:hypothetical protein
MTTLASDSNGKAIQALHPGATVVVAAGASSAASGVLASGARVVRLYATVNVRVEVGVSPVATQDSMPLLAGTPEYFSVPPGERVAAIKETGASDGSLYVTGME